MHASICERMQSLATNCCKDGETQADPIDCLSYYVCCSGVFVPKSCSSGNYWNPSSATCQLNNGQCCPNTGKCTENELQVDPQDCAAYYLCVMGQLTSQKCASGTYFDTTIKACVVDTEGTVADNCCQPGDTKIDEEDCTKYYACCTGQFVLKTCSSGMYWNPQNSACETNNGECSNCGSTSPPPLTCTNGETQADSTDCTKYQLCTNGQFVSKSCATGNYWNSETSQCETDNGQCNGNAPCTNGETQADSTDCTKYQLCTNGQFVSKSCATGNYWNSETSQCETDNGQCNGNAPCTNGETQADSTDCTKYQLCTNGQFVSKSCATGNYWNSETSQCETDNGQCNGNAPCTNGETQADSTDCTKYQLCTNGQFVSKSCATGNYWNSETSQCETDNGQCNGNTPCTNGELQVNPTDCAGYLQCVDNALVPRKCGSQTYFNAQLLTCVVDTEGVCIPNTCEGECCDKPNNWIGSVANNCSAFIQCLYGNKIQMKCPNNLQFNSLTLECDYPENVNCDDGSPPPSGPSAGPSGTYCESGGRCVGQRDGAMFADATNACSGAYIVCQCECEVNFTCSAGLVFNQNVRSCDWPENSNC
ncbi:GH17129 [Drosophila grimshawi]|uniref:GH17129 n=1 Tax=Drosophila grimshawi TaxID=7222 RepID=B4J0P3_DROGR|nr:GH17129 [Drosophila grimshawi]